MIETPTHVKTLLTLLAIAIVGLLIGPSFAMAAPEAASLEFFETKVRPVLAQHCYECHGPDKQKSGLRLDHISFILKGGDNGPSVTPGKPDASRLIEAIRYANVELQMPPKSGKLPAEVIASLETWVKMGAPWPDEPVPSGGTEAEVFDIAERKAEHWSWRPVQRVDAPAVKRADWVSNDIDRFILARLEADGLTPAAPAERRTLIRRLSFDLTGLPPTPEQADAFVNDASPDAYERLVDRLLASPRFGERWARHWMDLVRYAESRGHEFDFDAANAHEYRDYLIRAFNADVPYDTFVTEHIAGDLMSKPRTHPKEGFNESILGTGFWFLGEWVHSPVDIRKDETDRFDNMVDVMTKTFLGLTVACARCHDHKFDAISTADYYALYGFLQSSGYRQARFDTLDHNRHVASRLAELHDSHDAQLKRAVVDAMRPTLDKLDAYLLAAVEVRAAQAKGATDVLINAVADRRGVDAGRVRLWVAALEHAVKDADDPLYAYALVATKGGDDASAIAAQLVTKAREQQKLLRDALEKSNATVVIDYAEPSRDHWLQDGSAYGVRPAQPGDLRLGSNPARPIEGVITAGMASRHPAWAKITWAPGVEQEPGSIGGFMRYGQTLRTPTYELRSGRIYYLVRGKGVALSVVDSHRTIKGPLHGEVVTKFDTKGKWQWVSKHLDRYIGHRMHTEFVPEGDGPFEVRMVVVADSNPGEASRGIIDPPNGALLAMLSSPATQSLNALAEGYRRMLTDAAQRFAGGARVDRDTAEIADWLVRHADLFYATDGDAAQTLANSAKPLLDRHAALLTELKLNSRLAPAMLEGDAEDEYVLIRGNPNTPGEIVHRRFLEGIAGTDQPRITSGSGRLELAERMLDESNPYITRVMVNRIWHYLFGRGIAPSVDNFGVLGQQPTHPELLDWLAHHFRHDAEWSVKRMIKLMVMSSTYRQSSKPTDMVAKQLDPANDLLHRMRVKRLEGEAIRDAVLAISGRLDDKMYGPSVPVHLTSFMTGRGRPKGGPLDGQGRRSIYIAVRRNFLSPMMLAFDTPIPFNTIGRRATSNVPAQALIMMNDPMIVQQAEVWAKRLLSEGGTAEQRIERMYTQAYARPPSQTELTDALRFVDEQAKALSTQSDDPRVWADLAHVMMNVKEFIFVN